MNEAAAPAYSLQWIREAPKPAKQALLAASLGWMLDSFDVMLYALVLNAVMHDLSLSKSQAGLLGTITLVAAAVGGLFFGYIADRFGRVRALMASVLVYAIFTAACGLAHSFLELAVFRMLLGFGMGGEWASGAALVSETWPAEHRGKALGIVQSSWAIGYALAAATAGLLLPWLGWRAVFLVGIVPAFVTILLRRKVAEPEAWVTASAERTAQPRGALRTIFQPGRRGLTVALTLMNACTLFAWWGFNLWVPAFLSLPRSAGGIGLSTHVMAIFIIFMQVGMWFGYVSFGFLSDRFGRKTCYVLYLLCAAAAMAAYSCVRRPMLLFALGPVLAFFGTGYFTGFGTITSELYESRVRATAQGFTYNTGRIVSAAAPFVVGSTARVHGFGAAFGITAGAFVLAACFWFFLPETRPARSIS